MNTIASAATTITAALVSIRLFGPTDLRTRHINYHNTGWGIMIFAPWLEAVIMWPRVCQTPQGHNNSSQLLHPNSKDLRSQSKSLHSPINPDCKLEARLKCDQGAPRSVVYQEAVHSNKQVSGSTNFHFGVLVDCGISSMQVAVHTKAVNHV